MADPRTINLPGSGTATQQYELAPGLAQYVQSVYVEIDNSGGGDAQPTLSLSEQSGVVIAKKQQGQAIDADISGSATWALRLTDEVARLARGSLAWLHGLSFSQTTGSTLVPAGQNRTCRFDGGFTNNDAAAFETIIVAGDIVGFKPKLSGMYGVWIASQWDVAAFDKMIGYQSPLVDGLYNGRNSNSEAVYAFFLLAGLSTATTIFCVNKNLSGVDHNVTFSAMTAVFFGAT